MNYLLEITRLGMHLEIPLESPAQRGVRPYARGKRLLDILGAVAALIIVAPLFAVVAVLIKFDSAGPVFYRQIRCGRAGREFWIWKFRSMPHNVENGRGPVWGAWDDPRSRPLGRFLRITGIDELPQLFNVLTGDMSLIGPRPERPHFVDMFRQSIPDYEQRHAVRPGITGWAQVNGYRGNTSVIKRVEFDLDYIVNLSLWRDLVIIGKTPLTVLQALPSFLTERPTQRHGNRLGWKVQRYVFDGACPHVEVSVRK